MPKIKRLTTPQVKAIEDDKMTAPDLSAIDTFEMPLTQNHFVQPGTTDQYLPLLSVAPSTIIPTTATPSLSPDEASSLLFKETLFPPTSPIPKGKQPHATPLLFRTFSEESM
jgi:hypothetical protein